MKKKRLEMLVTLESWKESILGRPYYDLACSREERKKKRKTDTKGLVHL